MPHLSMQEDLAQFKFTMTYDIQWGDMDAAQHVNNVNYLRLGESARTATLPRWVWIYLLVRE